MPVIGDGGETQTKAIGIIPSNCIAKKKLGIGMK
jgi:hypothetical protein